jgi:hypothetical protein
MKDRYEILGSNDQIIATAQTMEDAIYAMETCGGRLVYDTRAIGNPVKAHRI